MPPSSSSAGDSPVAVAAGPELSQQPTKADDLTLRGKNLRAAIEQRYQELARNHTLQQRNNIDDVVAEYIPKGMSFDDAGVILHNAGLQHHIIDLSPNNPCLNAFADLPSAWFVKVDVSIYISPAIPRDFHSKVGQVRGLIGYATL